MKSKGEALLQSGQGRYRSYPEYKDSGVEWLGDVPVHWEVKRLRYAAELNPVASEARGQAPGTEVSFVPMEAIGEYGGLDLSRTKLLGEVGSGYTYFRNGDVILAKITPCFENGKGAEAVGLVNKIAFGTTELHVLRTGKASSSRFLFYLTLGNAFRRLGEAEMYGAGGQKRVPESYIEDSRHPFPAREEQQTIAAFLDRETAKIDALVAKKERLIELLQEKRTALITNAVTRGLDPDVPLKDSGVEWLGKIPAHWDVIPFTKYLIEKSDYRGNTPEKIPEGVLLVTARNVRMGFLDYECSQEYVSLEGYADIMRRGLPKVGDILFTTEAPLGNVALVDREDIALAQRIIRFRVAPDSLESRYALFTMMADPFQRQLQSLSTGSTAEGLKASKLNGLRIAAPSVYEQRSIAIFLDRETAKLDALVTKVREAIERLREYRTALISAAVTGKIDVRGVPESPGSR